MQGLLELAGVPYVGAGVPASALCMDKDLFKTVHARPAASRSTAQHHAPARRPVANPFGYPVFVKPARLGSSVGISKAHDDDGARAPAVALALRHDEKVLVEEFVAGIEVECGVLGNREAADRLAAGRDRRARARVVRLRGEVRRGRDGAGRPAGARRRARSSACSELAVDAFVATECEGMARVDFFVRDDGEVLVNELNTIPGFTATSVYAKLFEPSGIAVRRAARPADRARARAPRARARQLALTSRSSPSPRSRARRRRRELA